MLKALVGAEVVWGFNMDALKFFKDNKNEYCFASNHFDSSEAALKFVKKLYNLGALDVVVSGIYDEDWRIKEEGGPYADTLMITLPKSKNDRLNIQAAIFKERPDEVSNIDWNTSKTVRLWWD